MHDNLGLGLSYSQALASYMNGDVCVKHSENGFTNVAFKILVAVKEDGEQIPVQSYPISLLNGKTRQIKNKLRVILRDQCVCLDTVMSSQDRSRGTSFLSSKQGDCSDVSQRSKSLSQSSSFFPVKKRP
jgi:hypothetical protein